MSRRGARATQKPGWVIGLMPQKSGKAGTTIQRADAGRGCHLWGYRNSLGGNISCLRRNSAGLTVQCLLVEVVPTKANKSIWFAGVRQVVMALLSLAVFIPFKPPVRISNTKASTIKIRAGCGRAPAEKLIVVSTRSRRSPKIQWRRRHKCFRSSSALLKEG